MSWLSIVLQGARAFAAANPEVTQELVKEALDVGIKLHQKYEEQQAAKAQPKEGTGTLKPKQVLSNPQNLPGA